MYDAQGGVDGERQVQMIAAAHISGGGVPEKGKRMVQPHGLGLSVDSVFPEPKAIAGLLNLNEDIYIRSGTLLIKNDRDASGQWNRGIGFMVVVPDQSEADKLINIAATHDVEAAVAGKIIDKPEIQFRGDSWRYDEK
jgi:phosphoribosylaminoimidazole (AIR) synthetase